MTQVATPVHTTYIRYEDFLKQYADVHAEWVDGKVELMPSVTAKHTRASRFLYKTLTDYAQLKQTGEVMAEPYNMKLSFGMPGREPDILFVRKANLARITEQFLDGPADLVVEVISPESRKRDRKIKFAEYERAGVQEYWIADPETKRIDFYVRDENGQYQSVEPDAQGVYHSTAMSGFWMNVNWVWQDPQPTVRDVLQAWGMLFPAGE